MKTVVIDNVEYIEKPKTDEMQFCIIRCRDAGVHAGYVKEYKGREVHLIDSRRLWEWYQMTLSELAIHGATKPDDCKYGCVLPEIILLDACEIIPCSRKGRESIQTVKEWKND